VCERLERRFLAALGQYEACRRALREELNVEPGPEKQRLYERPSLTSSAANCPAF
jgi:hypothetical protein